MLRRVSPIVARAALLLVLVAASFAAGVFGLPRSWAVAALVASGLGWLLSCAALRRADLPRALVWGGFFALRALAWSASPPTSPDVQRYAWEAEVWLAGFNPYVLAPDASALEPLARELSALHSAVEHRSIPAIYPPLAQVSFVLAVLAARAAAALEFAELALARIVCLRALAVLGDFAVAVLLERWIARRNFARGAWLAWGWCPLVALEFAGAGHFDALGIALALTALSPMAAHAPRWSAVLLASAVSVKLVPLCFAAWLPRAASGRRPLLLFGLATALLLAPQAWSVRAAPHSSALVTYAGWWESTSAVYTPLRASIEAVWGDSLFGLAPQHVARRACAAVALVLVLRILWRTRSPERGAPSYYLLNPSRFAKVSGGSSDPTKISARPNAAGRIGALADAPIDCGMKAALSVSAVLLLLSPTFHPWYATWAIVWATLVSASAPDERASGPAPAMAALAALAPAQYVMLERWHAAGEWSAPAWLWPLMFAAPLALLVRAGWLARTR